MCTNDEMKVHVRLAIPNDAEDLVALRDQADPEGEFLSDSDRIRAVLSNGGSERIFLAVENQTVVGYAILQLTDACFHTRPTAELTNIFVHPSYRRRGVASELVKSVIAEAEKAKSLELFLRVNRANRDAIEFYERNKLSRAAHYVYRKKYYGQGDT